MATAFSIGIRISAIGLVLLEIVWVWIFDRVPLRHYSGQLLPYARRRKLKEENKCVESQR